MTHQQQKGRLAPMIARGEAAQTCSECQQPVWLWKGEILAATVVGVADKVMLRIAPRINGELLCKESDLRNQ